MKFVKRIFLFLFLNFLVCTAISLVLILFNVQPVLTHYGLNIVSLSIMCLLWGMAGALISLALSRKMAKWIMGVQLINPNTSDSQEREVYGMVASLAREAGLPMPQVGIFRSNEANAFATGPTRKRSLVAVSSGLLQRMNPSQVRGVLGHELAHIANGDMVTMTLLQGVVNAFVMFLPEFLPMRFPAWAAIGIATAAAIADWELLSLHNAFSNSFHDLWLSSCGGIFALARISC